jgi:hypothetical protein
MWPLSMRLIGQILFAYYAVNFPHVCYMCRQFHYFINHRTNIKRSLHIMELLIIRYSEVISYFIPRTFEQLSKNFVIKRNLHRLFRVRNPAIFYGRYCVRHYVRMLSIYITAYIKKGDKTDCSNFRGMSLYQVHAKYYPISFSQG